ncbi:molybdopterin molybdenumtransferase MoeA, partial [Frankia sp. Cpl3]|nr:molybdopterin molybdenumtransferase MoeA [Frankia sp. Cpl3]
MRFQRETITVEEARSRLLSRAAPAATEKVNIFEAVGRTLGEDLHATYDLPPFARSSLDGYAVRAADTVGATVETPVYLNVVETTAAGDVPQRAVQSGETVRIMTGALIPDGADAVIMFEQTVNPGELSERVGVRRELQSGENIAQ